MAFLRKKRFSKKSVIQNLEDIYGIGRNTASQICNHVGILPYLKFDSLREDQLFTLLTYTEQSYFLIENNLKRYQKDNKNYFNKLRNFKGLRNKIGFPTRGQRTHTNANTKKKLKNG